MATYNITVKEVGNPRLLHPSYTSYTGDVDEQYIIKFFGLKESDVEWYKIEKV